MLAFEMPWIPTWGLVSLVAALAVFSWGYRWFTGSGRRWRLALFLAGSVLSVPALMMPLYYLHVLPERAWFYEFRSWPGSELCVLPLALAAAAFASWLPRRGLIVPLFGLMCAALVPYLKPLLGPLPASEFQNQWSGDGACLQSTAASCGPASVATILRACGVAASEREIARSAHSYQGGTEAWYLARYIRQRGLTGRFEFRDDFDPSVGLPAVTGVRLGSNGHFIAVLAVTGDRVVFADPLSGRWEVTIEEFRQRYRFTGFHLVIGPAAAGRS